MKLITDEINDSLENVLFNEIKGLFEEFEFDLAEMNAPFENLPIKEYRDKVLLNFDFLMGEPLKKFNGDLEDLIIKMAKQNFINRLFRLFSRVMGRTQSNLTDQLDVLNGQTIANQSAVIARLQENVLMRRRWLIQSNNITRTIKRRMKDLIRSAINNNQRTDTLARSMEGLFRKYNQGKAFNTRTIARTEMQSVVRNTEWDYAKQLEKTSKAKLQKHWYTRNDEKVRIPHYGYYYDGWIALTAYFTYAGRRIRFPHDPQGSASDVINCRCRLGYRELRTK